MAKVMLLVGESGATLAETRLNAGEDAKAEAALREEARVSGFTDEEVQAAKVVIVGKF